ncbi:MAG: S8 family serine peptidase [Gemmatimonadetes bacterium]|nr:S8 family serine peptidase [Gemmatimonadota bacterium]
MVNIGIQDCTYDLGVDEAVARAQAAGILVVSIAGNLDLECPPQVYPWTDSPGAHGVTYPGKYQGVITVSGTDVNDTFAAGGTYCPNSTFRDGSRHGPQVTVAAPFWSYGMREGGTWHCGKGTSFAAPAVAGVLALIWTAYPSWPASAVRENLITAAVDMGGNRHDEYRGYGRVSAWRFFSTVPPTVTISGWSAVRNGEQCT